MCTVVPSFLESSCLSVLCGATVPVASCAVLSPDKMFSKDTAFQHALSTVPSQLLTAINGSALDQPGVLVAHIEGVLEDGTEGGDITGTGIPTATAADIVSMVSISSPSSSSLSLAASSATLPLLLSFSFASPSLGTLSKPVEKRIRSRKGEKLRGGKKEWKTGVVEEREERSKEVKCVGEAEGNAAVSAAGRVALFSLELPGSPVDSEVQDVIATATESAKKPSFSRTFAKFGKLRGPRHVENLQAERSSNGS